LARTIGNKNPFLPPYSDTGADTGYPGVQYRGDVSFPLFSEESTTFGVGGHWAIVENDTDIAGDVQNITSWSVVLDASMPITDTLSHKGQFFWGRVLETYFGNIGQSVGLKDNRWVGTRSKGWWYALTLKPTECSWSFNAGGGTEEMTDSQASHVEDFNATLPTYVPVRKRNWHVFGNALYNITPNTQFGIEVSKWRTAYLAEEAGDAWRIQTSFNFYF